MRTCQVNLNNVFDSAPPVELIIKVHLLLERPALSDEPPFPRQIEPVKFLTARGKNFREVHPDITHAYIDEDDHWDVLHDHVLEGL